MDQRPYGCTFIDCSKTFCLKDEWKYHENTHHQLEAWRCPVQSDSSHIGICAQTLYRKEQFIAHLREAHGVKLTTTPSSSAVLENMDPDISREAHVGRNGQIAFWCGFCIKVVALKQTGLDAIDERFDHIAFHFHEGESITSWYPINKDQPIENLRSEGLLKDRESAINTNDSLVSEITQKPITKHPLKSRSLQRFRNVTHRIKACEFKSVRISSLYPELWVLVRRDRRKKTRS